MPNSRPLVGREEELNTLISLIADEDVRVLYIEGETGCGKTALATEAIDRFLQVANRKSVRIFLARSGQVKGVEDWLLTELASNLAPTVPPNATNTELERLIIHSAQTSQAIVLIDNAESLDKEWLSRFLDNWLSGISTAQLIVTSTLSLRLSHPGYRIYPLGGLLPAKVDAIFSFLGSELQDRFSSVELLAAAKQLGYLPQRLLYMRWLNPEGQQQLAEVATELAANTDSVSVASIRKRSDGFVGHYLALGHVRTLQFDEELLAALWDSLGGGSAAPYVAIRDRLLREGLLVKTSESANVGSLRINPGVHLQLEKLLASSVGVSHLPHIDYFLSGYFRQRFEKSSMPDLQDLGHYIYHSARCGNLPNAAEYVLSDRRLETLRGQGLTLALRRVLIILDEELDTVRLKTSRPAEWRDEALLQVRCRTLLELARCQCELSEYVECLNSLSALDEVKQTLAPNLLEAELRRKMNILRGISFGCLGRLEECIRSYVAVVSNALDSKGLDPGSIEALGYAAMVTGYIDMERALSLGECSLTLAESLGDELILTKNRCSLGQTALYSGRFGQAVELLGAAEEWCRGSEERKGDRRELGRVLIPAAMVMMMVIRDGEKSLSLAKEALAINLSVGDRRRYARAKIVEALATICAGMREKGASLLDEGLDHLYTSRDWLNLVLGALTSGYLQGASGLDEIVRLATVSSDDQLWAKFLKEARGDHEMVPTLGRFWERHYLPLLQGAGI